MKSLNGKKVLLIDDDRDLLQLASHIFKTAGAQVFTARDGLEGISMLFTHSPNLIILDIMMPGQDGITVCERIRQFTNTPLIMLTALDGDNEVLQSLLAGADDFITKPFNPEILLARSKAVLRRSDENNGHQKKLYYNDGYMKIDTDKYRVLIKNKSVKLTPVEFKLLTYLARNAGKVISFEQILSNVWGSEYKGNDDYVHVYISQLRRKIEPDVKNPQYLISVHGVGYMFERHTYDF